MTHTVNSVDNHIDCNDLERKLKFRVFFSNCIYIAKQLMTGSVGDSEFDCLLAFMQTWVPATLRNLALGPNLLFSMQQMCHLVVIRNECPC